MCNRRDILHPGLGLIEMKWDEMKFLGQTERKVLVIYRIFGYL